MRQPPPNYNIPPPHLDPGPALLLQQNIFGFHITMNDFVFVQDVQTLQHAVGKFADQLKTESLQIKRKKI